MARERRAATKQTAAPEHNDRFRDRIVELRRVRCGDIEPHPMNPRTHSAKQLAAVTGLLVDVGKARALYAFPADGLGPKGDFSKLMYADGHGRQIIDRNEVWPVNVMDLTMEEATEMLFADSTGEMSGYDPVKLDAAIRAVDTGCAELQEMLADLWASVEADAVEDATPDGDPQDAEPQVDRAEELMQHWQTAPNQLWICGRHRVLCGDSTVAADVKRVMGGEKADCVLTDPPYGMGHKSGMDGAFGTCEIIGDETTDARDTALAIVAGIPCLAFGRWTIAPPKETRMALVWNKGDTLGMGALDLPWKPTWELIFVIGKGFVGERGGGVLSHQSIGPYQQARGERFHPTQKPVSLISELLAKCPGGSVYDPFAGSFTTMIACENLGRRGFFIEVDPKYVAVGLERYHTAFPDQEIKQAQ